MLPSQSFPPSTCPDHGSVQPTSPRKRGEDVCGKVSVFGSQQTLRQPPAGGWPPYSTVTLFARFLGWSTSRPSATAAW